MRNLLFAGATIAFLALDSGALAADATKDKEKKTEAKPAAAVQKAPAAAPASSVPAVQKTAAPASAGKPTDKGAEKGIILQQPAPAAQKTKATSGGASPGSDKAIILQHKSDPAAEKGIILQKPADKTAPAAPASAKTKTTGG